MIGYGELYWPDFVEHDGCILAEPMDGEADEQNYRHWLDYFDGDRQAVEKMINHVDLAYLIRNPNSQATDEQLTYLGRLLREMWQAKLASQFPGREIVVEVFDEGGDDPMITVYQPWRSEGASGV